VGRSKLKGDREVAPLRARHRSPDENVPRRRRIGDVDVADFVAARTGDHVQPVLRKIAAGYAESDADVDALLLHDDLRRGLRGNVDREHDLLAAGKRVPDGRVNGKRRSEEQARDHGARWTSISTKPRFSSPPRTASSYEASFRRYAGTSAVRIE